MKGFLITVGIFVAVGIVVLTQIDTICDSYYEKVLETEGLPAGQQAFEKLRQDSPGEFRQKYEEAFRTRLNIAKAAYFLGGDAEFKKVAIETKANYLGTPFDKDNDFAIMLHRYAKTMEDRNPPDYYKSLLEIQEHFPDSSFKDELEHEIKLIKIRLNII